MMKILKYEHLLIEFTIWFHMKCVHPMISVSIRSRVSKSLAKLILFKFEDQLFFIYNFPFTNSKEIKPL